MSIAEFDLATGIAMRDYPNGAEDSDAMNVATKVKASLEEKGYAVTLLKKSITESVSYRERVDRAEKARSQIGISIHTYTDDQRVFPQRVGLYREGISTDGQFRRVAFNRPDTARTSQNFSNIFASVRSKVENRPVLVSDNSFDGRAPLWSGNIPVISLISENVPWVYNEFGINGGGGSNPIGPHGIDLYAESLTQAAISAVPNRCT